MTDNFKCNGCGHSFFEHSYSQTITGSFRNRHKQTIVCPACHSMQIEYCNVKEGIPEFGLYSARSPEEKRRHLQERSRLHSKTNKPDDK
jgi:hypothetical protein